MKRIAKIALLVLMLALTFALCALPAFASGEPTDTVTTGGEAASDTVTPSTDAELMPGTTGGIDISVDFARFTDSLQYMWKGMLCIFIVIGVIIVLTWVLNTAVNSAVAAKEAKKNSEE